MDKIPQYIKDFSSGMITNINENLTPKNSVALGINVDFDEEIGSAVTRLGSSLVNTLVAGKTVLGLHFYQHPTTPASNKLFGTVNDSGDANADIFDVVAGTVSLADDTKNLKTRFLTFLGSMLRVNGTDAPKAWTGSAWITTAGVFDLANMPTGFKIVIEYLDRVYLMGKDATPDLIQYSSTPFGSPLAVSWTVGNGSVNLEPEEGAGGITGAGKVPGYLLIFKRHSMKRWNFVTANPESMVGIGTSSHESVVNAAGLCGFFSDSDPRAVGFYVTDGSYPVPISHLRAKNIRKWIDAIPSSFYENVSGYATETHMIWSIGDVTVDGKSYTNVQVRWSIKTGEWAVRYYPFGARVFSKYVVSGVSTLVVGTTSGVVVKIDNPSTFDDYPGAVPIPWEILTQEETYGMNQIKEVSQRAIVSSRNLGPAEFYIVAGGSKGKKEALSEPLKGDFAEISLKNAISGNYFQYGIRGMQKGSRATIKEIEIPNVAVKDKYV